MAVAGFDLTFTAPKSVSVLWTLADPALQERLVATHRAAVDDALALLEAHALFNRVGKAGAAQVPTRGAIAAAFEHWDTRTGDPNLHTHLVMANMMQGPDERWRSLDSQALHAATVAVSEVYDMLLADHVAAVAGVGWEERDRGPRRSPAFEVVGVPDRLQQRSPPAPRRSGKRCRGWWPGLPSGTAAARDRPRCSGCASRPPGRPARARLCTPCPTSSPAGATRRATCSVALRTAPVHSFKSIRY